METNDAQPTTVGTTSTLPRAGELRRATLRGGHGTVCRHPLRPLEPVPVLLAGLRSRTRAWTVWMVSMLWISVEWASLKATDSLSDLEGINASPAAISSPSEALAPLNFKLA